MLLRVPRAGGRVRKRRSLPLVPGRVEVELDDDDDDDDDAAEYAERAKLPARHGNQGA